MSAPAFFEGVLRCAREIAIPGTQAVRALKSDLPLFDNPSEFCYYFLKGIPG
jgi:hypothetical protein